MSTFNKPTLHNFRKDFDQAVKQLQNQYGVEIQLGNISFTDMKFTTKLTVTKTGTNADGKNLSQIEFERNAKYYELEASDFGKTFFDRGKTYKIVGINIRSRKSPIIVEDINTGKQYNAPVTLIKTNLLKVTTITTPEAISDNSNLIERIFADSSKTFGLDESFYKSIYTGPNGGKYYLIGFDNNKGILQSIENQKTCKLDINKIKKSLVKQ